jgi:hypothetical protein
MSLVHEDEDDTYSKYSYEGGKYDKYNDQINKPIAKKYGSNGDTLLNHDRKITDCLCLLLFFAFLGAMGYLTAFGLKYGQMDKLMAPLDGDNKFCGIDAGYENHTHLYLTSLSGTSARSLFNTGVCVKECPQNDTKKIECKTTSKVSDCNGKHRRYNTKEVIGYCFPKSGKALPDSMHAGWAAAKEAFLSNPIGKYFNDMYLSSRAIYMSCGMALVYALIYIKIMSAFAEPIAWICVALI